MKHKDKLLHFAICAVGSAFLGYGFGIGAGLTKEWCDHLYGGKVDWWDLLADFLGTVIGGTMRVIVIASMLTQK